MSKVDQMNFILPKKRNSNKNLANSITNYYHADHIITVQGAEKDFSDKATNGISSPENENKMNGYTSPVNEKNFNGIIHSTMDGLKSNMKIHLPIITDVNEESPEAHEESISIVKNIQNLTNGRENTDLSPIYENSSEACSSHDDLMDNTKPLVSENRESSATPNSLYQSDTSFETGTDSFKNSAKRKKRVNIISENGTESEITALKFASDSSLSPECSLTENSNCLTMTGTIKRGKKKGQNVDVKLNISREELELIEASIVADEYNKMNVSKCSLHNGAHIFLFTLTCLPFVVLISAAYSFYVGTMTWYSVFTYVTEKLSCVRKVVFSPIVIMSYPFLIVTFTVLIGLYAGIVQLTFSIRNWWKEVLDFEKGFYGWLCNFLGLSECSPYEVVILMDIKGT